MSFFIHSIGDHRIEARLRVTKKTGSPLVLIVHPDPSLGGNMDNPIVLSMEKAFFEQGFSTLCLNYSTKQQSALCKGGESLPDFLDISMALDWAMQEQADFRFFWIAGVAYGAYLALQITMRRPEILHFVVASVPVMQNDLAFLAPCPVSGLVLQSAQDHTMLSAVEAWTQRLSQGAHTVSLKTVPSADYCLEKTKVFEQSIRDHIRSVDLKTGQPLTRPQKQ